MDMNILKYMAFLKAVEYGSFTRAAEALNYSQSGVSRMIHDLEKEWNITLLERSRSGIRLTGSSPTRNASAPPGSPDGYECISGFPAHMLLGWFESRQQRECRKTQERPYQ